MRNPLSLKGMTALAATLIGTSTVAIAVSDQDATKQVFEQLGLETVFDAKVAADFAGSTGLSRREVAG